MSARSPEEILKAIEDVEFDVAVEHVLAMSPEERRRELEANGVDVKALHATADAFYARLQGQARDRRRISPRWVALLAATLGAAVIGATAASPAFLAKRGKRPSPHDSPSSATALRSPSPLELRERATGECSEHRWQECVDDLTAARTLDPAGDADERVQDVWRDALQGLDRQTHAAPKFDTK